MFHTDIGQEYFDLCTALEYGPDKVREFCLNGVEAAWLTEAERTTMRREFEEELDALEAQVER